MRSKRILWLVWAIGVACFAFFKEPRLADAPLVPAVVKYYYRGERISVSPEEFRDLVIHTAAEAGGEDATGKAAVAHVVLKRVLHNRFPGSLRGVIRARTRSGRAEMEWVDKGVGSFTSLQAHWDESARIVLGVLEGRIEDPFPGAYFYLNPKTVLRKGTQLPSFACDDTFAGRWEKHAFYDLLPWGEFARRCLGKRRDRLTRNAFGIPPKGKIVKVASKKKKNEVTKDRVVETKKKKTTPKHRQDRKGPVTYAKG